MLLKRKHPISHIAPKCIIFERNVPFLLNSRKNKADIDDIVLILDFFK